MNIIKFLRKPHLSVLLTLLTLFSSCSQYESDEIEDTTLQQKHSFNYEIYNEIISKDRTHFEFAKKTNLTDTENRKLILKAVNDEFNTDVIISDDFLELQNHTTEEIFDISLANGWITNDQITIINKFTKDIESTDFNNALKNMENNILALDLTEEEFKKYNLFVNTIKVIEHDFVANVGQGYKLPIGSGNCWLEALAVTAAGIGFAGACISPAVIVVAPCVAATITFTVATVYFHNCMEGL